MLQLNIHCAKNFDVIEELSELKMLSAVSHRAWITNGRPKEGPINDYHIQCKMNYKNAIKAARRVKTKIVNNGLTNKLLTGDSKSFWSFWRSKFGCKVNRTAVINDLHDAQSVSNEFANSFKGILLTAMQMCVAKINFYQYMSNSCRKIQSNFISVLL